MVLLGPLDRRTLRKRCVECSRRKIKCKGGPPCQYCIKTKRKCVPQSIVSRTDVVFVSVPAHSPGADQPAAAPPHPTPRICPKVPEDNLSLFSNNFFSHFLVRNDFGATLDLGTIISQSQKSPSLYHASIAVGALDMSRRPLSHIKSKDAALSALTAYHTSITIFQTEIEGKNVCLNDINLWTTLFLGLFELMYDKTGEGWVKHILYGTSKILQLRGPEAHLIGPGRSFYLTARVFEICRSLIYSEPTFLWHSKWRSLMIEIKKQDLREALHPKEDLFDLMIQCSSLSCRVRSLVRPDSQYTGILQQEGLLELAAEGLSIQSSLDKWYTDFKKWSAEYDVLEQNFPSILAEVYFHGISIYLSGVFDYHTQFSDIVTPAISHAIIQSHIDMILTKTAFAMKTTNLSPVLFFFPLRVAGARVTSIREMDSILDLLQGASKRNFPVAGAFIEDLMSLWEWKGTR